MRFLVTDIDRVLLLQTLYVHASPKGYGELIFSFKENEGLNPTDFPKEECLEILKKERADENAYLIDYHNGKPMKVKFHVRKDGELFIDSTAYDMRHGRFRFLEAMLLVFHPDEILIIQKGYPRHILLKYFEMQRPWQEVKPYIHRLKTAIKQENHRGSYWTLGRLPQE